MGEKDRYRLMRRSGKPEIAETGPVRRRVPIRMARVALAGGAAAAVALGVGPASASIPGPHGVISGCYSAQGGRLRVIDAQSGARCRRHERQLTWDQAGPQGVPGPQGKPGPQGPPGNGHLYIAGFSNVVVGASPTDVAVLDHVPAGTYLVSVNGQGTVAQNDTDNSTPLLTCSPTPSTTSYVPDSLPVADPPAGDSTRSIGAQGDSVLTTAGTIIFSCQAAELSSDPSSYPTLQGVITAIPVGGVN
jgi:hypothetical protein